jgi:gamma-glutamylputrescine oxidase
MVSDNDLTGPDVARPATYYHATRNAFAALPRLNEAVEADVCIIGGGLTGVSTALHLAERGFSVVLLEAERIGHGASGRNGGQLVNGYSCEMARIRDAVGAETSKLFWAMGRQAMAEVDRRIAKHGISCDRRSGYLFAARNARQLGDLEQVRREWEQLYGYDRARMVPRDAVPSLVRTDVYAGGLADPGGGQIHVLNYLQGLAEAARAGGARLFERSAAIRIERGARPEVHTAEGRVRARFLVLAGNAYLGGLVPEMGRQLARVTSFVGATAPLDTDVAARIMPGDVAVADCNTALDYFRMTGDGRLLFGAGASYSTREPRDLKAYLSSRIRAVFPELASRSAASPISAGSTRRFTMPRVSRGMGSRSPDWPAR